MAASPYYGTYCRFRTANKKDGSLLMGADNLVGDVFDIVFKQDGVETVAWLRNRFEQEIGFFDTETSNELQLCAAKSWELHAVLTSVYFTESPEPGFYWGEAAVICYSKKDADTFGTFLQGVAGMISEGVRPDVHLGADRLQNVIDSKGSWLPEGRVPKIDVPKGTARLKDHCTFNEKMIEKARQRNVGCMIIGWVFLLAVVALIVFAIKSAGLF